MTSRNPIPNDVVCEFTMFNLPAFLAIPITVGLLLFTGLYALAQRPGGRQHSVVTRGRLDTIPATSRPSIANEVSIEVEGEHRVISSNGIPNHKTGRFPNRGNPHRITAQRHVYRIPANPQAAPQTQPIQGRFGIAVNGIPFDPGAAEFYQGPRGHDWQYEPLSGAIQLGIDVSHAHVQPDGNYHYHGLPTGLLDSVKLSPSKHSPIVGWAADGFPIYAVYGFEKGSPSSESVVPMKSSYRLKSGMRPGGLEPGGLYDGTFVADYEYVPGSGDLDECNGRYTITPEYPDGTYAYFLTEDWPVIPRRFRGRPSEDFLRRGGPPPSGRSRGRRPRNPGGFGPPPPRR